MSYLHSCSPVAKRATETFVQHVSVGGETQRMEFTREVVWLQESETVLQFVHGGEVLQVGPTHSDWYGYLTSTDPVEIGAPAAVKQYSVSPESTLEVRLVTTVYLKPVYESPDDRAHNAALPANHRVRYSYLPDSWHYEVRSPDGVSYPRPEREELVKEVTWSSKRSAEENAQVLSTFNDLWAFKGEAIQGTTPA